jgi:hypothetical protein
MKGVHKSGRAVQRKLISNIQPALKSNGIKIFSDESFRGVTKNSKSLNHELVHDNRTAIYIIAIIIAFMD